LLTGVLGPFLKEQGLEQNTQALIYFAVSKAGEPPIDGVTDVDPQGLTSVTGKWSEAFKQRLAKGNLTCHILDAQRFTGRPFEKHIWICSFMLIGVRHSIKVGEVESQHNDEVRIHAYTG